MDEIINRAENEFVIIEVKPWEKAFLLRKYEDITVGKDCWEKLKTIMKTIDAIE